MTAEREPLRRWQYPNREALKGNVFPSGKPPYGPFPSVTNVLNASLCPVASYHELLHGIGNALTGQYQFERRGDLFHRFIAHLKLSLRSGTLQTSGYDTQSQLGMMMDLFLRFAQRRNYSMAESSDMWRLYVSPWISRKLEMGELQSITRDDDFVFELSVGNSRVPFELEGGQRNYPLRGRIDEVDLTRRRLIERTIKGDLSDAGTPPLKDYQLWLLWRILCSLDSSQLPTAWSSVSFQGYELVVETPFRDFQVSQDSPTYVWDTHYAYSWINDISMSESPGVFREVFDNAACTPVAPHADCAHGFLMCFPRNYPYPQSRPEIKQTFKPWYRLLLWEQLWEGHLFQYQLLMLTRDELRGLGLISEGRVVAYANNRIELEVDETPHSLRGYDSYTIVPFGTLFCGKKMAATLVSATDNRLTMQIGSLDEGVSQAALLLPSQADSPPPIMQEPPVYLKQQTQSALLRLQNAGVIKQDSASRKSIIQLLEAVFGTRLLRRGPQ